MYTLDWLPFSNNYLVKHAYLYIAFKLLMTEFVCSEHKKGVDYYKEKIIGYRTLYFKQILNRRWEPVYLYPFASYLHNMKLRLTGICICLFFALNIIFKNLQLKSVILIAIKVFSVLYRCVIVM